MNWQGSSRTRDIDAEGEYSIQEVLTHLMSWDFPASISNVSEGRLYGRPKQWSRPSMTAVRISR